jgi:DNA-binding winged helix-turn-helix (wHTH) protein
LTALLAIASGTVMADTPPAPKTRVAKVSLAGLDSSTPQAMHVAYGPLRATARRVWQGRDSVYEFEGWEVDLARRELRAHGVPVPLGSRAFQILAVLVQSAGELVTKDELMARVWPGAIVEENKLQVHISAVRKALGTDRGTVKTYFGRGYRLVGNWTIRKESTPADPVTLNPNPMPLQPYLTNVPTAGRRAHHRRRPG